MNQIYIYILGILNLLALTYVGYLFIRRSEIYETLPGIFRKTEGHVVPDTLRRYLMKTRAKKRHIQLSKNFYRIYKYMYVQSTAGTRTEDIFKSLHKVVASKVLQQELLQFSVIMSQSHDLKKALNYLKAQFVFEDGEIFISIMESVAVTGLPPETFLRLDQMLFQKYLSHLRRQTARVKRLYLMAVILFTVVTSAMLLFPLIDQAMQSADMIFS